MAALKSIVKEVKDISECPICTEMFCNPKMLPCFRMFCLECLEQCCKDKAEGDTMPCPMCRREFLVPTGGLSKLSVNFFIERLIAVQSASDMKEVFNCDGCLVGNECAVEASSFCMECKENTCDPCSNNRRSMKISMTHHLSTIGDPSTMEAIEEKNRRAFCEKHPAEEIKFFCRDCKIPCCTICFVAKHNKHECCDIGETVEECEKSFMQYSDDVNELLNNIKERSDLVDKQLASFFIRISTAEKNILEKSEELKQMVESYTQDLLVKLGSHKTQFLKNVQTTKEELQRNMMMCENFIAYCWTAIKKVNAVESIRIVEELRTRAVTLKENRIPALDKFPDIIFHPSDLDAAAHLHNFFGHIHVKHSLKFEPQGIAIFNNQLFCVFPKSPGTIRVYDIEPFALQRSISAKGMKHPYDIVAGENVLYVTERGDISIHKIQLPEGTVTNWTATDGIDLKLSIAKNGNVIVASWNPDKIREYTSDGTLVREITVNRVDTNLVGLRHAIQLEEDKFLVCHYVSARSHVCIIDNTGRVIKSYGGNTGSGMGQLNGPCHLAIDRNGCILVADHLNNRIVQLNALLDYINEFVGLKQPIRLRLDEQLGRVYVVEMNEPSITVRDMRYI